MAQPAIRCGAVVKEHFRFHGQVGFSALQRLQREYPVRSGFPFLYGSGFFMNGHELILKRIFQ